MESVYSSLLFPLWLNQRHHSCYTTSMLDEISISMWTYKVLMFKIIVSICFTSSLSKESQTSSVTPTYLESLLNTKKYEEFIKILQIPNKNFVDPSQRKTSIDMLFSYSGLNFSDILVRNDQILNPDALQNLDFNAVINLKINKWKNGIIPYYITNTYSDDEVKMIKGEIDECNQYLGPNVHIRPYQEGDVDYVLFFKGGCACYGNLGNVGGPQVISLLSVCLFRGAVLHEMQHALGIAHEANRFDRDKYIRLVRENIPEELVSQYERYSPDTFVNVGPFDYYSMMGFPTMVPGFPVKAYEVLQDGIDINQIGTFQNLTETDIKRVKTIYKGNAFVQEVESLTELFKN